jgi:hypothetical protein
MFGPGEVLALTRLSAELGIPSEWLWNIINAESSWNPEAVNAASGAAGLIQFTNTTARSLGYGSAAQLVAAYPNAAEQLLGPVRQYMLRYAPYASEQSVYLAVFYPAARSWAIDAAFPQSVIEKNPSFHTVGDYVDWVKNRGLWQRLMNAAIVLSLLVITVGVFLR